MYPSIQLQVEIFNITFSCFLHSINLPQSPITLMQLSPTRPIFFVIIVVVIVVLNEFVMIFVVGTVKVDN
jgi:hypothetical protein